MDNKYIKFTWILFFVFVVFSCTDDLERYPTNGITSETQFSTLDGYTQGLATIYGQANNNGENWSGGLFREYFNLQEAPTDETIVYWNALTESIWTSGSAETTWEYSVLMKSIAYANNFLNEAEPGKVASRGFSGADADLIELYVAEARFLRAWYYWMLMDLFGNPPFATEETLAKGEIPRQIQRADLFEYIENELLAVESQLMAPRQNEYGRIDKAAAWALLARLYLNGKVYTSIDYYTEAITYCKKVIDAGYSLESEYAWLTLGDNHLCTNEFIFSIPFDNVEVKTWQGTNYMVLGASGLTKDMNGLGTHWSSFAFKPEFVDLFPSTDPGIDSRAMMYTDGRTKDIENISNSTQGYSAYKYRNFDRNGDLIPHPGDVTMSDVDFPVIRLAEIYLIYAEAVLRGGTGGDEATALTYINKIRERAYQNANGNITINEMTLDFILDERGRELYWECHRRTDLIRFDKFTSPEYLWAWKGGIKEGKGLPSHLVIYPIPNGDEAANPYVNQNPGY